MFSFMRLFNLYDPADIGSNSARFLLNSASISLKLLLIFFKLWGCDKPYQFIHLAYAHILCITCLMNSSARNSCNHLAVYCLIVIVFTYYFIDLTVFSSIELGTLL